MAAVYVCKSKMVKNMQDYTLQNIARIANSCPESGRLSRCWGDKKIVTTQKLKLWKKTLKTQFVTKLKNSNCDKTQKLKLWQNSITETKTKHKNFKFDKI